MISLRIVKVEHYMSKPEFGHDVTYSEFRGTAVKQIPVIRIFGTTDTGEKACLHVHNVFPYIYVPYDGQTPAAQLMYQLASSLDKAINISFGKSNSTAQHVHKIIHVVGRPLYGYHEKSHQYFKIFFYNPLIVKSACDLLQNGAVCGKVFQCHEAHVPYILQFFIDYKLYGMSFIRIENVTFRTDCIHSQPPNGVLQSVSDNVCSDGGTDSKLLPLRTTTYCELECDGQACDILNVKSSSDDVANPGLAGIWAEERARHKINFGTSQITQQNSQNRTNVHPTASDIMLRDKLKEAIDLIKSQQLSMPSSRDVSKENISYPIESQGNSSLLNASFLDTPNPSQQQRNQNSDHTYDVKSPSIDFMDESIVDEEIAVSLSQPVNGSFLNSQDQSFLLLMQSLAANNASSVGGSQPVFTNQDAEDGSILATSLQPVDNVDPVENNQGDLDEDLLAIERDDLLPSDDLEQDNDDKDENNVTDILNRKLWEDTFWDDFDDENIPQLDGAIDDLIDDSSLNNNNSHNNNNSKLQKCNNLKPPMDDIDNYTNNGFDLLSPVNVQENMVLNKFITSNPTGDFESVSRDTDDDDDDVALDGLKFWYQDTDKDLQNEILRENMNSGLTFNSDQIIGDEVETGSFADDVININMDNSFSNVLMGDPSLNNLENVEPSSEDIVYSNRNMISWPINNIDLVNRHKDINLEFANESTSESVLNPTSDLLFSCINDNVAAGGSRASSVIDSVLKNPSQFDNSYDNDTISEPELHLKELEPELSVKESNSEEQSNLNKCIPMDNDDVEDAKTSVNLVPLRNESNSDKCDDINQEIVPNNNNNNDNVIIPAIFKMAKANLLINFKLNLKLRTVGDNNNVKKEENVDGFAMRTYRRRLRCIKYGKIDYNITPAPYDDISITDNIIRQYYERLKYLKRFIHERDASTTVKSMINWKDITNKNGSKINSHDISKSSSDKKKCVRRASEEKENTKTSSKSIKKRIKKSSGDILGNKLNKKRKIDKNRLDKLKKKSVVKNNKNKINVKKKLKNKGKTKSDPSKKAILEKTKKFNDAFKKKVNFDQLEKDIHICKKIKCDRSCLNDRSDNNNRSNVAKNKINDTKISCKKSTILNSPHKKSNRNYRMSKLNVITFKRKLKIFPCRIIITDLKHWNFKDIRNKFNVNFCNNESTFKVSTVGHNISNKNSTNKFKKEVPSIENIKSDSFQCKNEKKNNVPFIKSISDNVAVNIVNDFNIDYSICSKNDKPRAVFDSTEEIFVDNNNLKEVGMKNIACDVIKKLKKKSKFNKYDKIVPCLDGAYDESDDNSNDNSDRKRKRKLKRKNLNSNVSDKSTTTSSPKRCYKPLDVFVKKSPKLSSKIKVMVNDFKKSSVFDDTNHVFNLPSTSKVSVVMPVVMKKSVVPKRFLNFIEDDNGSNCSRENGFEKQLTVKISKVMINSQDETKSNSEYKTDANGVTSTNLTKDHNLKPCFVLLNKLDVVNYYQSRPTLPSLQIDNANIVTISSSGSCSSNDSDNMSTGVINEDVVSDDIVNENSRGIFTKLKVSLNRISLNYEDDDDSNKDGVVSQTQQLINRDAVEDFGRQFVENMDKKMFCDNDQISVAINSCTNEIEEPVSNYNSFITSKILNRKISCDDIFVTSDIDDNNDMEISSELRLDFRENLSPNIDKRSLSPLSQNTDGSVLTMCSNDIVSVNSNRSDCDIFGNDNTINEVEDDDDDDNNNGILSFYDKTVYFGDDFEEDDNSTKSIVNFEKYTSSSNSSDNDEEIDLNDTVIECNSEKNLIFVPKIKPPTYKDVIKNLSQFNLTEIEVQKPYYSNPSDVTEGLEIGGTKLKLLSNTVNDLEEFKSNFDDESITNYRKNIINTLLFRESTSSKNIVDNYDNILTSECNIIIKPLKKPPSFSDAKKWLKVKNNLIDNVSKPVDNSAKFTQSPVSTNDGDDENLVIKSLPIQHSTPIIKIDGNDKVLSLPIMSPPCTPVLSSKSKRMKKSLFNDRRTSRVFNKRYPSLPLITEEEIKLDFSKKRESLQIKDCNLSDISEKSRLKLEAQMKLDGRKVLSNTGNITCVTPDTSTDGAFKFGNENLQDARSIVQHQFLTLMAVELHVHTRGDLRPDPDYDAIKAIFYYIHNDVPLENFDKPIQYSGIVLIGSLEKSTAVSFDSITSVNDEHSLVMEFVQIVRKWDPDMFLGYEIEMLSWGYLIQRAYALNVNLNIELSRVIGTEGQPKYEDDKGMLGGDNEDIEMKLAGRIVLNVWRLLRHEVALQSYTFESIMYHILHRRIPLFSFRILSQWWEHRSNIHKWMVVEHYMTRVKGIIQLLDQLDLIGRTSELARLFGIQFYEVLSRGSQFRVESMMLRMAKPQNYVPVSPTIQQRAKMRAPESLPLIMEPHSRMYNDPVIVLDFQSLYPSIIIAYNYCYSTCLGRVEHLAKSEIFEFGCTHLRVPFKTIAELESSTNFSPSGVAFVNGSVRRGILPIMLEEILNTRLMVKRSLKQNKGNKTLERVLHNRQLGLKLIANVTYGYTAANFSGRMPCVEIGDSVVSKGRETLERAIAMVTANKKWGAQVVYGDTDSLFVLVRGKTRKQAFEIGNEIAEAVTNDNPKPVKLKLEKVYQPCILQTKKRYVGYMYESADQEKPVYDAKGIETVRRDGCPAVSKILEKSLRMLFETKDVSSVKQYVIHQFSKLLTGRLSIQELTFAREYRGAAGYKPGACVPALELAREWVSKDKRAEPRVGERVPYVIVSGHPGVTLIKLVRSPMHVLNDPSLKINAEYYITRVIIPPLNRCFSLIGANVHGWYLDIPRKQHVYLPTALPTGSKKSTISQYFATVNCVICEKQTMSGVCEECQLEPQLLSTELAVKLHNWERKHFLTKQLCQSCCGRTENIDCISLDCPILYKLFQTKHDLRQSEFINQLQRDFLSF